LRDTVGEEALPIIMNMRSREPSELPALAEGSRKEHRIAARNSRIVFFTGILSYDLKNE
jgi:hypothetical protein